MIEKVIYLEGIEPVNLYGVKNARLEKIKEFYPKLKIIARGDEIKVKESSRKMKTIHEAMQRIRGEHSLPWLILNKGKMEGIFVQTPERDQIDLDVNEQLVVELYSK